MLCYLCFVLASAVLGFVLRCINEFDNGIVVHRRSG